MVDWYCKGYFSDDDFAESIVEHIPDKLKELDLSCLLENGNFADLGCGLGNVLVAFQRRFPHIPTIGVDINRRTLSEAKKIVNSQTLLIYADLTQIPLRDNSVALAFSHKIWDLLEEKPHSAMREIHRILEPRGVYISTGHQYQGPNFGFEVLCDPIISVYVKN